MVFEGIRGNGYSGDIAIDDVEFTNFACSNLPSNSVPVAPTTAAPRTPGTTKAPTPGEYHVISLQFFEEVFTVCFCFDQKDC